MKNSKRNGNFTSSEIYKLIKKSRDGKEFGELAKTYIFEKYLERFSGMSLNTETDSKPTNWGKAIERFVFDKIGSIFYELKSDETEIHPDFNYWVGTPDLLITDDKLNLIAVGDIKCPFTKKSFIQLVLPYLLGLRGIECFKAIAYGFSINGASYPPHPDGEKYYIQLVSNAIIKGVNEIELVVYLPKYEDLDMIKNYLDGNDSVRWIQNADYNEIPHIPFDSDLSDLYTIRAEVDKELRKELIECVLKAGNLLNNDIIGLYKDKDKPKEKEPKNELLEYSLEREVLKKLIELSDNNYKFVESNLRDIKARIKEGYSEIQFFEVIELKCIEWKDSPTMSKYLRPSTLFNKTKFENYINEVKNAKRNPQQYRQSIEKSLDKENGIQYNDSRTLEEAFSGLDTLFNE